MNHYDYSPRGTKNPTIPLAMQNVITSAPTLENYTWFFVNVSEVNSSKSSCHTIKCEYVIDTSLVLWKALTTQKIDARVPSLSVTYRLSIFFWGGGGGVKLTQNPVWKLPLWKVRNVMHTGCEIRQCRSEIKKVQANWMPCGCDIIRIRQYSFCCALAPS